jgi:hypothetical protein
VFATQWPGWVALGLWVALETVAHRALADRTRIGHVARRSEDSFVCARCWGASVEWVTLSIDPHASRVSLLKTLAYGSIFSPCRRLCVRALTGSDCSPDLVYCRSGQSVYAVLLHLSGVEQVWFGRDPARESRAGLT